MALIRLTANQIAPAARMLASAFANDPLFAFLVPDAAARPKLLAELAACIVRYGLLYGKAHATSPGLEGIAVWLPPKEDQPSVWRLFRVGFFFLPLRVGWRSFRRSATLHHQVTKTWQRLEPEPCWYLQILGVDPASQRRGHGRSLLEAMLARLERDGLACRLETTNQKNLAFYERFGFRVRETMRLPGTELDCWFMIKGSTNP